MSPWALFEISGWLERRGCDLSRIGEARVIWRWLGRTASLWELFRIKGSFEGHVCDLSQFGGVPESLS